MHVITMNGNKIYEAIEAYNWLDFNSCFIHKICNTLKDLSYNSQVPLALISNTALRLIQNGRQF